MQDYQNIREKLEALAEPEYQKFASSLIPTVSGEKFLGVRLPNLRKIAGKLAKGDWRTFLEHARDDSFEEIMLQGMVIGYAKGSMEEIRTWTQKFLLKIDNWSVCDSFCSGLKIARAYPEEMWEFLMFCIADGREYFVRFAVVMLLNYYVSEPYLTRDFKCLDGIRHESYYVKMAVAWAVSICYRSFPGQTMEYLKRCALDDFTYKKALQKIMESRCTDKEMRKKIKDMKR